MTHRAMTTRRGFCSGIAAAGAACFPGAALCDAVLCDAHGSHCSWKPGHFQVHMIFTGTSESLFLIFPDSTTLLLDCGDADPVNFQAKKFGPGAIAIPPEGARHPGDSGEVVARYVESVSPNGRDVDWMMLTHFHGDHSSGFERAAERLRFKRAVDRGWPDYDDPLPCPKGREWMGGSLFGMRELYARLGARDGLSVEKFRVGETDQLRMVRDGERHDAFHIFNLCGCGKIAMPDGSIHDVYGEEHASHKECVYDENAMSLGCVFTYGRFRFFTAGDFTASDRRKGVWRGEKESVERTLARACSAVDVAKVNHHAGWTSPKELVAALRPRWWIAPVWWKLHCDKATMNRLSSREAYDGPRTILPGMLPRGRRESDASEPYLADVPPQVDTPSHIIVDVPPGGETYHVACIDASDGNMRVKAVWRERSFGA